MRRDFEHRGEPENGGAPIPKTPLRSPADVLVDKPFWRFMVLLVLLSLVRMMFQHMQFTWPKYVIRERGDGFPVGIVWGLNSLLILGLAPLCTAALRRHRPLDVLLVGAFISSISPFVLVFGSTMPFQLGMVVLLTIGEAMWSPRLYSYNVSDRAAGTGSHLCQPRGAARLPRQVLRRPNVRVSARRLLPSRGATARLAAMGDHRRVHRGGPHRDLVCARWIDKKDDEAPESEHTVASSRDLADTTDARA